MNDKQYRNMSDEIERRFEAFADAVGSYEAGANVIDKLEADGWTVMLVRNDEDLPGICERTDAVKRPSLRLITKG